MSNFKKRILYQVPDFKKDSERPILTQNSKVDPLRVKISNESQLIRDFQGKISRNTCLTRFFWNFFEKLQREYPVKINLHQKHKIMRLNT